MMNQSLGSLIPPNPPSWARACSLDAAEMSPAKPVNYWHTVPGARNTFRVICLVCATPFTM